MKAADRFRQLMTGGTEEAVGEFLLVSMELGREIAAKGARGETLTATELNFLKHSALFVIQGLAVGNGVKPNVKN